MAAVENRNVADDHISAEFEAYRFVAPAVLDRVARAGVAKRCQRFVRFNVFYGIVLLLGTRLAAAAHEPFSPYQARTEDRDVFKVLAPDQTIVPVRMAEILVFVRRIGLCRIVSAIAFVRTGREQARSLVEIKGNIALEPDRKAAINARRKKYGSASARRGSIDRFIDGRRIQSFAVTFCAEGSNV